MTLQELNIHHLGQLGDLIGDLPKAVYVRPVPLTFGASVGQHVRHIIEFYQTLQTVEDGLVCYDERKRDKQLEENPSEALAALEAIRVHLEEGKHETTMLRFVSDYNTIGGEQVVCATSWCREMAYALDHGIHHMAIIKIALNALGQGHLVPAGFGVAPSTIRHKDSCAQ